MKQMNIKKSLGAIVIMLAVLFALPVSAQLPDVTVKVPNVKRFVRIKADNVNVRRLPNATSGKLMQWSSDGGSIDTYCKVFFADTEGARYKANSRTGAYVSPFHPYKNQLYMVNPQQQEAQNGWYQIFVTAEEYDGNRGHANAKLAWINASFCEVIDVNQDVTAVQNAPIPVCFKWDDAKECEVPAYSKSYAKSLQDLYGGAYKDTRLTYAADYDANVYHVSILTNLGNFIFCTRCDINLVFGANPVGSPYKIVEIEPDMEDADPTEVLQVSLREAEPVKSTPNNVLLALIKPSTAEFKMFYNWIWRDNKIPTESVYFVGTNGETYRFSYNPELINMIGYNTYTVTTSK